MRSRRDASISVSMPRPGAAPVAMPIVGMSGHGPDPTRDVTVPLPPTITRSMSSPMNRANDAVGTTCHRNSASFRRRRSVQLLDPGLAQLDAERLGLEHAVVIDRDGDRIDVTGQPVEPGRGRLLRRGEGRCAAGGGRSPTRSATRRSRPPSSSRRSAGQPSTTDAPVRAASRPKISWRRISPPQRRCSPARRTIQCCFAMPPSLAAALNGRGVAGQGQLPHERAIGGRGRRPAEPVLPRRPRSGLATPVRPGPRAGRGPP